MPVWVLIVAGQLYGPFTDPGSCQNAIRHLTRQQINSGAVCKGPIDSSQLPPMADAPQAPRPPANKVCVEAMPGQIVCQ